MSQRITLPHPNMPGHALTKFEQLCDRCGCAGPHVFGNNKDDHWAASFAMSAALQKGFVTKLEGRTLKSYCPTCPPHV